MARIPSRIQQAPSGAFNPANPGRAIVPATRVSGPAFPQEQFADPTIDPNVKRALVQLQNNVRAAFGTVKGSPLQYANIIQGWTLVQGGANGASPNVIAHGLGQPASGYIILSKYGGYLTGDALIPNPPTPDLIQIWTTWTAFAGVTSVTADLLIYS